jgi:uncharacterized oligopeptide transporter (OPT) family protein
MGKVLIGSALMGIGVIWYFGWPGAVFVLGGFLTGWGVAEEQDRLRH